MPASSVISTYASSPTTSSVPIDLGVTRRRRSSGGSSTPGGLDGRRAELVERPARGAHVGARAAPERGRLQVGQHVREALGAEGGDRRRERAVRADREGRRDEELGPVGAQVALVRGRATRRRSPRGRRRRRPRTTTRLPSIRPCAIPASFSATTARHMSPSRSSLSASASSSPSDARGALVTSRASPCSAMPTATTSSVGTPACAASSVNRASCSTRDRRRAPHVRPLAASGQRGPQRPDDLAVPRVATVDRDEDGRAVARRGRRAGCPRPPGSRSSVTRRRRHAEVQERDLHLRVGQTSRR